MALFVNSKTNRSNKLNQVTLEDKNGVRVVTMNRPKALNALNAEMMDELAQSFLDAATEDSIKVIVLTGAGRAFSAGADLAGPSDYKPQYGLRGMIEAMIDFPKPFIAAINGLGVGYGATVCGLADTVIMAQSARLRAPFSALGLTAELASTFTFPRLMGRQNASWFLMSAEWMSSQQSKETGLAQSVVPDENLLREALNRAATLAALPLSSLLTTKALIMDPLRDQMKAAMRSENAGLDRLTGGPANKEAVSAFIEKRDPNFTGL